MHPPGYLLVYSDPGDNIAEDEFANWHHIEHVPSHAAIPSFKTWHAWQAADDKKPRWAASYDLTSCETTQVPCAMLTEAETRSERGERIISGVETLDKRVYEQMQIPIPPPSSLYDPAKPAPVSVFVGLDVSPEGEESLSKWYIEEHVAMLSKCPGWIRCRRFILKEWAQGHGAVLGQTDVESKPPKYLSLAEFTSMEWAESKELVAAVSSPWAVEVRKHVTREEFRVFKLCSSGRCGQSQL